MVDIRDLKSLGRKAVPVRVRQGVPKYIMRVSMSKKNSIEYSELFGLRIFITRYKFLYEQKHDECDIDESLITQKVISEIEDRIQYLENK
jgi:hypothetical protein